jgi:hypothetical protein
MDGGPSHVDLLDHKPELVKRGGQSFRHERAPQATLLAPHWKFKATGQSGLMLSELWQHLPDHADDLCLIHSMQTAVPSHPQAFLQMHTGLSQVPRPAMGAWVLYGLGTTSENLPGFVSICPPVVNGGPANYGSSFLPPVYQGTPIGAAGQRIVNATISNLKNARPAEAQRQQLDYLRSLNSSDSAEQNALIESFELAFRMQSELPGVLDLERESLSTQTAYGLRSGATEDFGRQCLLARRLLEAGVRFVEVCQTGWDQHRDLKRDLERNVRAVDQPIAALLQDLKQRDLLRDTLVIQAGEFGRTPYAQTTDGRDHNHKGYSIWMAGGGVKGGMAYGRTDDFGYEAVENPVPICDWHATILHLLGLDHEKLTYRHAGREHRLTDLKGRVLTPILS